jgi:hypothetical protein
MLKSSSLCLYSSNFGTFCLKIEQFWYITGFLKNFELLPILTDYEIKKKGGMKLKKNLLL